MAAQQPLTVLITRPQAQAEAFAQALAAAAPGCWRALIAPLMRIVPKGDPPGLNGMAALIFTSVNGVAFAPHAPGLPAFCVGERTAEAARRAGFDARGMGADAATLIDRLIAARPVPGPWLHLRGAHARGDVARALTAAGIETREAVVYDQQPCDLPPDLRAALTGGGIDALPLFSPRTATLLRGQLDGQPIAAGCTTVCLSPAVAEALGPTPGPVEICREPDGAEMVASMVRMCRHRAAVPSRKGPRKGPRKGL